MTPDERIAQREAENARQREQIAAVVARVQELEARLAKDRHNSSKLPSSDGLARKTKRLRKCSGKRPGGQLGHRGETLRLVRGPDESVEHRPAVCSASQTPLDAQAPVVLRERRPDQEVPPLRLQVTAHQALHCTARPMSILPDGECRGLAQRGIPLGAVQYGSRQLLTPG